MSADTLTTEDQRMGPIIAAAINAAGPFPEDGNGAVSDWQDRVQDIADFGIGLMAEFVGSDIDHESYKEENDEGKRIETGVMLGVCVRKGQAHIAYQTPWADVEILPHVDAVAAWEEHRYEQGAWSFNDPDEDKEGGILRADYGIQRCFIDEPAGVEGSRLVRKARSLEGKAIAVYKRTEGYTNKKGQARKKRLADDIVQSDLEPEDIVNYGPVERSRSAVDDHDRDAGPRARRKQRTRRASDDDGPRRGRKGGARESKPNIYDALIERAKSESYTQEEVDDALREVRLDPNDLTRRDIKDVMDELYALGD